MKYTATYSPDDNKLRLYASGRLDSETYERVRAAGFRWAPKQELFVAPAWSPQREDLLLELAGQIDDEDKTLTERQEERAERFESYSESRTEDAEAAYKNVQRICDGIPLGQPILVGHHSERHARADQKRIHNGMDSACKNWKLAEYWQSRAKGAIAHAKYKERPDVRARRIKGLESDIRVYRAKFTPDERTKPQVWEGEEIVYCKPAAGGRGGSWIKRSSLPGLEAHYSRWIAHCEMRLEYERAMLAGDGGTIADKTGPEAGGACKCWVSRGTWLYIQKVNKISVALLDNWGNGGANFTRTIPFDKLKAIMTRAEVESARERGYLHETPDKTGFVLVEGDRELKPEDLTQNDGGQEHETLGSEERSA